MKKIGILTACRTNNNGTDLQALAMQCLFSKYSETELINYKCDKLERSHRLLLRFNLASIIRIPYRMFSNWSHTQFRKHFFHFSEKVYDRNSIKDVGNRYDAIVVGSDQIWNLEICGYDLNFFLPWKNIRGEKFSYAPSLGIEDIKEWEREYHISSHLKEFKSITVRENSGVSALKEIGIEAKEILDPLLAVDAEFWKSFNKPYKGKPYILFYQVGTGIKEAMPAINYARNRGWDVIYIRPTSRPISGIKTRSFVSVKRWLQYVQNSEMVVTDSYHGLSICISTHTNFRLVLMSEDSRNIRSLNLLNNVGLMDYILNDTNIESVPNWECSENILGKKRNEAQEYIRSICQ